MKYTNNNKLNLVPPPPYKPYNVPYEEWTIRWWQWIMSTTKEDNPAADETGQKCDKNQVDPNVWFLAGTFGGFANRRCTMSGRKAILFPIINSIECADASTRTESELCAGAKSDIDKVAISSLRVIVDDIELRDLEKYRVQSRPFDLKLANDNVLGLQLDQTRAVSDGFWIFLYPLTTTEHTIKFAGSCSAGRVRVETMYKLTVLS